MPTEGSSGSGAPPFNLMGFLHGRVRAWGIFEDRTGRVRRRFSIALDGRREGRHLVVTEHFRFDDGAEETRIWRFSPVDERRFTASTEDVVGVAEGLLDGDAARMRYAFRIPLRGRRVAVEFDDRFYRIDDDRAINRATLTKFGVRLGEVTIFLTRVPEAMSRAAAA
mgnify:CR=1 FL=1